MGEQPAGVYERHVPKVFAPWTLSLQTNVADRLQKLPLHSKPIHSHKAFHGAGRLVIWKTDFAQQCGDIEVIRDISPEGNIQFIWFVLWSAFPPDAHL